MRKALVAGNWKMNKGKKESIDFIRDLEKYDLDPGVEALICPPTINLSTVADMLEGTSIKLGAQNMFFEDSGSYTGETSPIMLKELEVEYVILGHSERREFFGENDDYVNKKVRSAFNNGLKPILCLGESLEERKSDQYQSIIKTQLCKGLNGLEEEDIARLVVAYEPVWAIGTGRSASIEDVDFMIKYIRTLINELYGDCSESVRILYGGSVKADNIGTYMEIEDVDGVLVGGASLEAESFAELVNYSK